MSANPLDEIRRVEGEVAAAIAGAAAESEVAIAEAKRSAERLVREARQRGRATADRRYAEGLARARDEAEAILADADGRVAELRRQAGAVLPGAVAMVVAFVLPEGG